MLDLDVSLRSCFLSHEQWVLPRLLGAPMQITSILPFYFAICKVFSAPLWTPPWMHYWWMFEA